MVKIKRVLLKPAKPECKGCGKTWPERYCDSCKRITLTWASLKFRKLNLGLES